MTTLPPRAPAGLTVRERQVYEAIMFQGLTVMEASRAIGTSFGAAANALSTARRKCRAVGIVIPIMHSNGGRYPNARERDERNDRARVAADVAAGVRCRRCHLLLPHDGCSTVPEVLGRHTVTGQGSFAVHLYGANGAA